MMRRNLSSDAAPWHPHPIDTKPAQAIRSSFELFMPDGTPLAVDLYLPTLTKAQRVPAILHQTRYFRAISYRKSLERLNLARHVENHVPVRERFLARGFAWVDLCLRGSGASGGHRPHPWSAQELDDAKHILDWIISCPWSNGRVATLGTSYAGACAELAASLDHPGIVAIAPRFAPFDLFPDILAPGGIRLEWFTARWGAINAALDQNSLDKVFTILTRENSLARAQWLLGDHPRWLPAIDALFDQRPVTAAIGAIARQVVQGVRPTQDNPQILKRRVDQHLHNLDIAAVASTINFRDDAGIDADNPTLGIDAISPHTRRPARALPTFLATGWFDGAYCRANAIRFYNLRDNPNAQLIIGPWDHLGAQHVRPHDTTTETAFDHAAELLSFFESGTAIKTSAKPAALPPSNPRVRYFVQGLEQWRTSDTWPPAEATSTSLYFGIGHTLSEDKPARDFGSDRWRQDLRHGSGKAARWRSMIALSAPIHYPDRRTVEHLVTHYTTKPLTQELIVAGHPILHLWVESDRKDFDIFAYLEDVSPSGAVHYITEGCLRASHRKLSPQAAPYQTFLPYRTFTHADASPMPIHTRVELIIDLLPTAYRFAPGHRLRISLAGTDADHFAPPPQGAATLELQRHRQCPSRLVLPIL